MASGRSNKLVGATGEYLVAAKLSRRGLIATTFTGNVPHYDIVASDEEGRHVSVQVKASRGSTWQFASASHYCEITFEGRRQVVGHELTCPVQRLVMVFVKIDDNGDDGFYIATWEDFRDLLVEHYVKNLERHLGERPKKWDSLHCAISEEELQPYRDNWDAIKKQLK